MLEENNIIVEEILAADCKVGKITLNRPAALNALNHIMVVTLSTQLKQWAEDTNIKAVIITGAGEKAFCAGGDVRQTYEDRHDLAKSRQFFRDEYRLNYQIFSFPKPFIAFMHGITMGGGAGVAVHGSHRIGAENLRFAMPETGIGFHPDVGASYFLPRCLDKTGFYLGLTGDTINAADAHYSGIIDTIVPFEKFKDVQNAIISTKFTQDANASVSQIINQFAVAPESSPLSLHRHAIDRCFSHGTVEKILEALLQENTEWVQNTVSTLLSRSPTALKVTLRELLQSADMSFADCQHMEYRVTCQFLESHDFYEGVRAALIDKDKSPHWQPKYLAQVPDSDIEKFFSLKIPE